MHCTVLYCTVLYCTVLYCDIRDYGKKVQQLEIGFDETNDKLNKANEALEETDKQFKEVSPSSLLLMFSSPSLLYSFKRP